MESIEVDTMNDGVPVLTWKAKIQGLGAEEKDNGTLQDCQDILLFISLKDVTEQAVVFSTQRVDNPLST